MESTFARHPLSNVGGTTCDSNALVFAPQEEAHHLYIHEAHFAQVDHEAWSAFHLDEPAQLGELLAINSAAHGKRRVVSVDRPNDSEHPGDRSAALRLDERQTSRRA